jgi:hypothetical protein
MFLVLATVLIKRMSCDPEEKSQAVLKNLWQEIFQSPWLWLSDLFLDFAKNVTFNGL